MTDEALKKLLGSAKQYYPIAVVGVHVVWGAAAAGAAARYVAAAIAIGYVWLAMPDPVRKLAEAAGLQAFANTVLHVPLTLGDAQGIINAGKHGHGVPAEIQRAFQMAA